LRPAPRTDPYLRNYLIRLLPWIGRTGVWACRILFTAFDQPGLALCPIGGVWRRVFSLARPLPSTSSAPDAAAPALFGSFLGTMGLSDFPAAYTSGLRPQAFPATIRGRRPGGVISELNGWPACCPVNACDVPLRTRRHDSGPWRGATAFHVRLFHSLLHAGLSRRSWCPQIPRRKEINLYGVPRLPWCPQITDFLSPISPDFPYFLISVRP